jgi:hypothetical protein
LSALAATLLVATPALAQDHPLYIGQHNHVTLALGVGLAGQTNSDLVSLQPTLEARFGFSPGLGLQLVLPAMFVDLSTEVEGATRFELANPSVALEMLLDTGPATIEALRFGVAIPVLSRPSGVNLSAFGDTLMQAVNVAMATGARGLFDMWRYAPDTLSLFAEFQATSDLDGVYLDFRGAVGLLIPTADSSDAEFTVQALGRVGFGGVVRPFAGLGVVLIPTKTVGLSGQDDAFQVGVQAGVLVELGAARVDVYAQINIDRPAGFSFDDNGVFGMHLAATVPF